MRHSCSNPEREHQFLKPGGRRLPHADPIAVQMRDDAAVGGDDGRVGHLGRVDRRLENGAQSAVGGQGGVRVGRGRHDLERPLVDGVRQQVGPRLGFLQPHVGQLRQPLHTQADHHGRHQRGDAEDLFCADGKAHGE